MTRFNHELSPEQEVWSMQYGSVFPTFTLYICPTFPTSSAWLAVQSAGQHATRNSLNGRTIHLVRDENLSFKLPTGHLSFSYSGIVDTSCQSPFLAQNLT